LQRLSVTVEVLRVGVMIVGVISVGVMTVGVLSVGVMIVGVLNVGVMTLSRTIVWRKRYQPCPKNGSNY
jgi:hypothetical protein